MKKNRLLIRCACLLLALLLLTACGGGGDGQKGTAPGETSGETAPPGETPILLRDFQIVRPDVSSDVVKQAALRLNRTLEEVTGSRLTMRTDYEESDRKPLEILVGETSRAESGEVLASLAKGDYTVQTVKHEGDIKLVLLGKDDMLTDRAVSELETLLRNGEATAEGALKSISLKANLYELYSDFTLEIGEPIVVVQSGKTYRELGWGPYQFPKLHYTTSGDIIASWHMSNDQIYGGTTVAGASQAVSEDGGLTWREVKSSDKTAYTRTRMKNGKYFVGFAGQGSFRADYIANYTPAFTSGSIGVIKAESIAEYRDTVYAEEYDPSTGSVRRFECRINWPHAAVNIHPSNVIYPISSTMSIGNSLGDLALEDKLYFCTYTRGFDLSTGGVLRYGQYYTVYVFESSDNARTWNCISQIPVTSEVFQTAQEHNTANGKNTFEGFCEPMMSVMPDGSVVMLMRTGENQPSYLTRSTDGCKTWSKPAVFDGVGVLPQIVTLSCGVSLASYGRYGLYLRATSDRSGLVWQEPISVPVNNVKNASEPRSCYYTYFLQLDEDTVLWVYSDFYYSETGKADGAQKCVMARVINVKPK